MSEPRSVRIIMKPVIAIVGALSAGSTATLLEFLASALGLVIAANLQSAVTLTSRRRLFVRGSATLRDATWGMSITDGLANPRRMFKDRRSLFAVALAVIVLLLVGLTVFQAQPGDSCSFEAESTWSIERKELGCYEYSLEAEMGSAARYFAQALEKVSNVDVDVGIPENTDVFEDSILTRASVTSLKSLENRFVASILQTGKISNARFDRTAASIHPLCFEKSGERHDNLCWQSDYQLDINPVNWTREDHIWYTAPIGLEATGNASIVMSSGFAWAQSAINQLFHVLTFLLSLLISFRFQHAFLHVCAQRLFRQPDHCFVPSCKNSALPRELRSAV